MTYFLLSIGRGFLNLIYCFHKLCPVKNRISFISRQSKEPSTDVLMLAEELRQQSPDTEVVISCRMIDPGLIGKIRYFFHMITKQMHLFATSQVVILDGYCIGACMLKHRKNLKIVQMWHAMGALKKFGYCTVGEKEGCSRAVAQGMRMHQNYNVIFISSEACREPMAAAFGCEEDRLEVMPLPRTDLILDPEVCEKNRRRIRERYPQIGKRKVILYAPTFRKNQDIRPYVKDLISAVDTKKYCLIVKLHPLDQKRVRTNRAIVDTEFSSLEMLSVADYVISDYSAFIFEAAVAGKPLFLYIPDQKKYNTQRGFLINPEKEIPAYRSGKAQRIMQAIENGAYDLESIRKFAQKYVDVKGNSTKNMAEYILHM